MPTKGQATLGLGFGLAVGFALLLTSCAVWHAWWPLFALSPWFLAPIPYIFTSSFTEKYSGDISIWENFGMCMLTFLGTGTFGLPIVMMHLDVITVGAGLLCMGAQVVMMASIAIFSPYLKEDSEGLL
mmetsp:Transcript_2272/g.7591  ORF Transcript_2272/g.7591 Transcript_2272/m.7591 type:complete len:128 (+) Transcript_2272:199-582(+)